ncbi:MAG: SPFH domain-containing protein [Thermotogota bacterium]
MSDLSIALVCVVGGFLVLLVLLRSIRSIGPTQVGLVLKRVSFRKLKGDDPIAFHGEAGYQAELLRAGLWFKLWPIYKVTRHPMVQVPAGEIGVVIAQVGGSLKEGQKSGVYKPIFGDFSDVRAFVDNGGQKGPQRPTLRPGSVLAIHPAAFLVRTASGMYGVPISKEALEKARALPSERFKQVVIRPQVVVGSEQQEVGALHVHDQLIQNVEKRNVFAVDGGGRSEARAPEPLSQKATAETGGRAFEDPMKGKVKLVDVIGIVRVHEGPPLEPGDIACRIGGFDDIRKREETGATDAELADLILDSKVKLHDNYQDFQAFLDAGGRIGLQHDPLLYGTFNLNPYLVEVELVPMLVVEQGQVAVIKSYVGLVPQDTSGEAFHFGTLVRPGHRGIWQETVRTGKYAINPRCYDAEIVPTSILTLNWATQVSEAHKLDQHLSQIVAKSREGFVFKIDLQVQIHVPDTMASRVISAVGTMENLVNEVLQAAVGNHFRDKLQSMPAIQFIENRQKVQEEAFHHIMNQLMVYNVDTRGVFIQDVILPEELTKVLTEREIANQQILTLQKQQAAETARISTEQQRGLADQQAALARSSVGIDIAQNTASARMREADGEATYLEKVGTAKGAEVRAVALAKADGYLRQTEALGKEGTTLVNVVQALAASQQPFVPEVNVSSGTGGDQGAMSAFFASLTGLARAGKLGEVLAAVGVTPEASAKKP